MSMRVYKYGLLKPTSNQPIVDAQMRAAHQYRNALIQIERERREAIRSLTRDSDASIQLLEQEVAVAKEEEEKIAREIKQQHQEMRSRTSTQTDKEELKKARLKTKELKAKLVQARKEIRANQEVINQVDLINEVANTKQKELRSKSNLYWGTYLIMEDAMAASKKAPLYDGDKPNDPRFVRWNGDAAVAVQFQGGLKASEVFNSKNTLLRIEPVDENAFYSDKRSERRKMSRTLLHLRVQSDDKGKPIWATWPMIMHRPLPAGSVIKWAKIHRKIRGPREEWYVCLTVDTSAVLPPTSEAKGAVAIDIGWRHMKDSDGNSAGFRIAKWRDEEGNIGEVKIEPELLGALKKANELRGVRDDNFNIARKQLADWMKQNSIPAWFVEETKTIAQWRAIARLALLVRHWASNRFEGDQEIYQLMEKWRYHDYHLWSWEANQRIKALRRRKDSYRVLAAQLADKYKTLVLEDFDLSDVSQKAEPDDKDDNHAGRSNKTLASPSEFRLALIDTFQARNGLVSKVDPAGTSYTCHLCLSKEHLDHTTHYHKCNNCGVEWDREDNATANLLTRWREQSGDAQKGGGTRETQNSSENQELTESRYERRKRARKEKEARMASARKEEDKAA